MKGVKRERMKLERYRKVTIGLVAGLTVLFTSGCSIRKAAMNQLGNALAGGGTTFAADEDPELIKSAAPFSLKLMETILAETPDHAALLEAAASGFTQYAYAFVQQEADAVEAQDFGKAQDIRRRARNMYLRAHSYGLRSLDARHKGFSTQLRENPQETVQRARVKDVPVLYWTAASWAAAITLSKDNPDLIADLPQVESLIYRALELDETYGAGAIHNFLISYEMSRQMPEPPEIRARRHFERAVELSSGKHAGPYVAFAESVCVPKQNKREFEASLAKALALDPNEKPEWRLVNAVMQRRAGWLLENVDGLILNE
jgi:predicted anti-sigma-YlaC factor YlaD